MKPIEVLRQARALITDPNHWVRGHYATNRDGEAFDVMDVRAERFCAVGALWRVSDDGQVTDEVEALMRRMSGGFGASRTNDRLGHKAVLALFDKTIAHLEARELEQIPVLKDEPAELVLA